MSPRAAAVRRAWVLVSGAGVAALATAVLLALVVVALVAGRGAVTAAAYGLAACGAACVAALLLVLARAGAVARPDPRRAETLCRRCTVGALGAVVVVLVAGGVAVLLTRSGEPMSGSAVGAVLVAPIVGLAARQRAVLQAIRRASLHASLRASARMSLQSSLRASLPPPVPAPRSGGRRESEPDRAAGAR